MQIGIAEAMASGAVPVVRNLAPLQDYVGPAGLFYDDEDGAEAVIRATTAWDDATWQEASRRAVDQAYLNHADDLVLQPLLEHWLSLVAPEG
jgi:glycosyltransferase involved in cell wall biosynthesis